MYFIILNLKFIYFAELLIAFPSFEPQVPRIGLVVIMITHLSLVHAGPSFMCSALQPFLSVHPTIVVSIHDPTTQQVY